MHAPRRTGRRVPDHRNRVLVALMLTMALAAMDSTIVATVIPQVVGDLGGYAQVGWVFSIYLLAQTVTIPVYGKLADLYGRKPVLLLGVCVFLSGSALSAISWNMLALIAFRALQGLGAGSIGATVNTIAGDLYDVAERGRVQGYLSSVWGISAIIGPAIGGLFAEYASWRWIFLLNLPVGAFSLLLIAAELHEHVPRHRHRIDVEGAALVLVAACLLIFGLLEGGTAWPWLSAQTAIVFGCALAAAAGAVAVERRAAEPIMPLWLWSRRLTAGVNITTLFSGLLVIGLSTFLPTWAQAVLGLGPIGAGFVLAVMSIGWPLASAFSSQLYLRIGFRNTALVGAIVATIAGVVFVLTGPNASPAQPAIASGLIGAGMGLITAALTVGIQSTVGWERRGVITGGVMFSRFLGQSLGAAVFGAVMNTVLLGRLHAAPADIAGRLPTTVDGVSSMLTQHDLPAAVGDYLRDSLQAATHSVFLGLLGAAVLSVALLVVLVPRHFPIHESQRRGTVPATR